MTTATSLFFGATAPSRLAKLELRGRGFFLGWRCSRRCFRVAVVSPL